MSQPDPCPALSYDGATGGCSVSSAHYQLTRLKYTAVYCSTAVVKDLQWNTASTTTLLHLSAVYTSSKREVLPRLLHALPRLHALKQALLPCFLWQSPSGGNIRLIVLIFIVNLILICITLSSPFNVRSEHSWIQG